MVKPTELLIAAQHARVTENTKETALDRMLRFRRERRALEWLETQAGMIRWRCRKKKGGAR